MPDKIDFELPLYLLFKQLQQYDNSLKHKALGTENYLQLIELLQLGYGLTSPEDLYTVCEMLWRKPHHHPARFRMLFDLYLQDLLVRLNTESAASQTPKPGKSPIEPGQAQEGPGRKEETKKSEEPEEAQPSRQQNSTTSTEEEYETVTLSFGAAGAVSSQLLDTGTPDWEAGIKEKVFRLSGDYLPIHPRTLYQGLRSLRIVNESHKRTHIDWPATIDEVARKGYLDAMQWKKLSVISSDVVLLIDRGGSMVAFEPLCRELIRAVSPSEKQAREKIFYFKNCPVNYLYRDPEQTEKVQVPQFKRKLDAALFIVSDAGAARGRFDRQRLQLTQEFLKDFTPKSVVWLNPMPRFRWASTTADYIAELVPMFAVNPREFGNAVKVFRTV